MKEISPCINDEGKDQVSAWSANDRLAIDCGVSGTMNDACTCQLLDSEQRILLDLCSSIPSGIRVATKVLRKVSTFECGLVTTS